MKYVKALIIALVLILIAIIAGYQEQSDSEQNPTAEHQQDERIQTSEKEGCRISYTKPPHEIPLTQAFVISVDAAADHAATLDVDVSALEEDFTASVTPAPAERNGQTFAQHLEITIEPNWHGTYTMPEILVSFSFPDHPPVVIPIPQATIVVPEPSEEEQKLTLDDTPATTPLQPPEVTSHKLWYIVAGSLAGVILLTVAAVILLRWKRNRKKHAPPQPAIPPHIAALASLQTLLQTDLLKQGQIKEFYHRISVIVRDYIEAQFGLKAPEQTTEEFLEAIQTTYALAFTPRHHDLINDFMSHTDLVKYARQIPTPDDIRKTVQAAQAFIQETSVSSSDTPTGGHHD